LDPQRALAPCDGFPCVVTAFPSQVRGLDTVTVETASRGMCVAPSRLAHLGAPGGVAALPVAAGTPWAEVPRDTGPLGILLGKHPPCDAPVHTRKNGIAHRPHSQLAVAPTRLGWWDHILDKIPCGIRKVCGVWMDVHPQSVLN